MDFDRTREYSYSDIMLVKSLGIVSSTYEDSEELLRIGAMIQSTRRHSKF